MTNSVSENFAIRHQDIEFHHVIGKGAFGTVYAGTFGERKCAIKEIPLPVERDDSSNINGNANANNANGSSSAPPGNRNNGSSSTATTDLLQHRNHNGSSALDLLRREATLLAKLNHPYLVTSFGYCLHDSKMFVVMEFCPGSIGEVLKARVQEDRRLPHSELLRYLRQVQQAIEHLHSRNVRALTRTLNPKP